MRGSLAGRDNLRMSGIGKIVSMDTDVFAVWWCPVDASSETPPQIDDIRRGGRRLSHLSVRTGTPAAH